MKQEGGGHTQSTAEQQPLVGGGGSEDLRPQDCVMGRGLCILNFAREPL